MTTVLTATVLQLDPADPLAVATSELAPGGVAQPAGGPSVTVRDAIAPGHKLALRPIAAGEAVRKFGAIIGHATTDIAAGEHIHTHNLAFAPNENGRAIHVRAPAARNAARADATFEGYVREDGAVGTRNYLAVMATVNCSATVVRMIADRFNQQVDFAAHPNFDGAVALVHQQGCAMGQDSLGLKLLRRTLGGYARHANVAGVLVVGLGCEGNQVEGFLAAAGLTPTPRLKTLIIQEMGGTAATLAAGVEALKAMLPMATSARRTTVSAEHLRVGLQCGGSDGFSALTANPALGRAVDRLVAQGGGAILSETPEIYGAEQLLLGRVAGPEVGDKLIDILKWWEAESARDGGSLDNNPAPGNKAGGITTILEKSLGAVAKAGSTPLMGVYGYAETIDAPGMVFMDSPGYDPASATGQIAAGANLICFTTGRGSCFGCKPAPSLKLATNSAIYRRMEGDFDIDCGGVIDGSATLDGLGEAIFRLMLDTASGKASKSELLGYGAEEFVPWTPGLTY